METKVLIAASAAGKTDKLKLQDDGNWGPADIIQKSIEFFRFHAWTYTWIQVTIVLPSTILMLLSQYYLIKFAHDFMPIPPPSPPSEMEFELKADPTPSPEWEAVVAFLVLLLLNFAFSVNKIGSLFFSVGSNYSGKTITFTDVLAALPSLWNGLIITGLWGVIFFVIVLVIVFLLGTVLMTFASVSFLPLPIAFLVTIAITLLFYLTTSLQMANGVTIFDQISGLPAFSKGLDLLKTKWCVALILALIYIVPESILAFVVGAAVRSCSGVWTEILLLGGLSVLLSLVLHFSVMSSALLYLSCKECHHETISADHFSFSQCQFESGYQRIAGSEQVV